MGRKHRSEESARSYVPNGPANQLDERIEKAKTAEESLREVIRAANQAIKDSKRAGDIIAARIVDELDAVGVAPLINAAVGKWLDAWESEMRSRLAEMEKRFLLYDTVMESQTERTRQTLAVMEQWVARFYAVAGTEKFQDAARKLVANEMQGPTGDPFHQVREDSRAFLLNGSKESIRVVDSDAGYELALNLETGDVHARQKGSLPADRR